MEAATILLAFCGASYHTSACAVCRAGMYADLDFEALKNIEPLLRGGGVFLAAMGKDESFVHSLPNAWMASVKGHPFWLICMQQVIKYSAKLGPKGCVDLTASSVSSSSTIARRSSWCLVRLLMR